MFPLAHSVANQLSSIICIIFKFCGEMSDACGHVTKELKILELLSGANQVVKT